ncbi:MAG TPA: hypothetical protein VF557_14135 [Jatrophihabitans sp.]|jgi:hypothetical protein|uniref:hypothetical protein n=1 Tax=Jatrophihabitans sp. TaxID=1932789 RepID=UPI002F20E909
MRTARRIRSLKVAVMIGVGLASMIAPLPAHATALTITELGCERTLWGARCEGHVSGGTGGYTFTWSETAQTRSDYSNWSMITIHCEYSTYVTFTVKDSSNATRSQTAYALCGGPID